MKALLLLLLACSVAHAGLTLTLTPAAQPGSTDGEALFSGTLTNTSATERLFLNDITASFTADPQSDTALSSNAFFAHVPGILLPGETYDGPLFHIALSSSAAAGNFTGSVTLQGGADITASSVLATASLTLLATPADQWRHRTFADAASSNQATDTADWDHDGVENLLEYAFDLDALTPDTASQPAPFILEDHYAYSFVPTAPDLTYRLESSADLLQWTTTDLEVLPLANPLPPNRLTYRFKQPMSLLQRRFLRLQVSRVTP